MEGPFTIIISQRPKQTEINGARHAAEHKQMDFLETIAMAVIRAFFNASIKKFTEDDLVKAIQQNQDLWEAKTEKMTGYATSLKNRFGNLLPKYFNMITTDLMLNEWLAKDRPEFALKIKTTPGGYIWFDAQVQKIKQNILSM